MCRLDGGRDLLTLFSRGDGFRQPGKIALGSGGDGQGDDFGDFVAMQTLDGSLQRREPAARSFYYQQDFSC
jgi:hypothetical protein